MPQSIGDVLATALTVKNAALRIGISKARLYLLISERRVMTLDAFGKQVVPLQEIERLSAEQRTPGRPRSEGGS